MADDLAEEVERLREDLNGAVQIARNATQRVADLEDELAHERQRRKELEEQVEKLSDDRELLNKVRRNGADSYATAAAVCIQTLAREARNNASQRAEMDAKSCVRTLNSTIHRTNTYDVFDEAEQLIDDRDVVWKQKESRSSPKNTRLIVDLSEGDLPAQVEGHDLTGEISA